MAKENPAVVTQTFRVPARNLYNHDCAVRFDTSMGFINPLKSFEMNPAERIRVSPSALIRTEPALAPILGRARCRIYAFWVPYHLYVPEMYTNGKIEEVELPSWSFDSTLQNGSIAAIRNNEISTDEYNEDYRHSFIQPNTLLDRLGWPVDWTPASLFTAEEFYEAYTFGSPVGPTYKFNTTDVLATWDIFRNYFADRNRDVYPLLTRNLDDSGLPDGFRAEDITLEALDKFYRLRQYYDESTRSYNYWSFSTNTFATASKVQNLVGFTHALYMPPIKPYMPDLNSAFASNTAYEEAIAKSIVRVANQNGTEGISMQSLLDGQRMYNFLNKVIATGGQLDEMIRAEFGVDVSAELDIPMFLRMWSFDLGFDTIFGTGDASTGEMRGRGLGALSKAKSLNFTAKHHGKVMFFMTIEPYVDYYQGFSPFATKTRLTDLFWPSFDRLGWQPLLRSQLDAVNFERTVVAVNGTDIYGGEQVNAFEQQVGVQPAYTEYKGEVSRLGGAFAGGNLAYWTFGRDYASDEGFVNADYGAVTSLQTTYINPFVFNRAFVDVSPDGMPYLCEVAFDCSIKRVISRSQLENF